MKVKETEAAGFVNVANAPLLAEAINAIEKPAGWAATPASIAEADKLANKFNDQLGINRKERYDIDKAVGTETDLANANKAIENLTVPTDAKQVSALKDIKKKFKATAWGAAEEYIISLDPTGKKYVFTK